MKMTISYIDLLSTSISVNRTEKPFKTSLEVIGKVLNVPESALKALLRLNGHDDNIEPSSICIDEEMLAIFAEAYVRKMRSYFTNSNRHLHLLSPQEAADLEQFYQTFKKTGGNTTNRRDWNQIDTELISEVFVKKVKEATPSQNFGYSLNHKIFNGYELFNNIWEIYDEDHHKSNQNPKDYPLIYSNDWNLLDDISSLCDRIVHSRFYVLKLTNLLIQYYLALSFFYIRSICVFARYYIFPSEDGDDNLLHTLSVLRL